METISFGVFAFLLVLALASALTQDINFRLCIYAFILQCPAFLTYMFRQHRATIIRYISPAGFLLIYSVCVYLKIMSYLLIAFKVLLVVTERIL